ncbi:hypothetical protein BO71DRAFT_145983 [Aspergillus ellipticus CBS 707.79]|uniref:Uncharacterized protein n=1 Tax=Aspergillus ellipticus CBS 707.79 TaxID=1448320 RepID=A0A319DJY1_9EURO|nr:hypothetical protein BO71DRAFT_145983 [Aspergillus ellipticus CBS 707.79]
MVVDLEQIEFPDQIRPWQYAINKGGGGGARFLMEEFRYMRNPGRVSSPLELWKSGYDGSERITASSVIVYMRLIGEVLGRLFLLQVLGGRERRASYTVPHNCILSCNIAQNELYVVSSRER